MILYSLSAAIKRALSEQRTGCFILFELSAHAAFHVVRGPYSAFSSSPPRSCDTVSYCLWRRHPHFGILFDLFRDVHHRGGNYSLRRKRPDVFACVFEDLMSMRRKARCESETPICVIERVCANPKAEGTSVGNRSCGSAAGAESTADPNHPGVIEVIKMRCAVCPSGLLPLPKVSNLHKTVDWPKLTHAALYNSMRSDI